MLDFHVLYYIFLLYNPPKNKHKQTKTLYFNTFGVIAICGVCPLSGALFPESSQGLIITYNHD